MMDCITRADSQLNQMFNAHVHTIKRFKKEIGFENVKSGCWKAGSKKYTK